MRNALALNLVDLGDLVDEFGIADVGNVDGSYGDIQYGKLWNCCTGNEVAVIVFDNRARYAVCAKCANTYTCEVQPLPTNTNMVTRYLYSLFTTLVLATMVLLGLVFTTPQSPTGERIWPTGTGPHPMAECVTEDGAGQALCTWDAATMGDGMGTSIISGDCAPSVVGEALVDACVALHRQGQQGPDQVSECTDAARQAEDIKDETFSLEKCLMR